MKRLSVGILLAVSAASFGLPALSIDDVSRSIAELGHEPTYALILTGVQKTPRSENNFAVTCYFRSQQGTTPPKVEIYSTIEGVQDRMWVADGENFSRYDARTNRYVLSPYKSTDELMARLGALVNGNAAMAARLIRDSNRAGTWTPWLPTGDESVDRNSVLLSLGDPVHTVYGFEFGFPAPPELPILRAIGYAETRGASSLQWRMKIQRGILPDTATFKFNPPAGAKPVPGGSSTKSSETP